jgi:hypothetical protein
MIEENIEEPLAASAAVGKSFRTFESADIDCCTFAQAFEFAEPPFFDADANGPEEKLLPTGGNRAEFADPEGGNGGWAEADEGIGDVPAEEGAEVFAL